MGALVSLPLRSFVGPPGAVIVLVAVLATGLSIASGTPPRALLRRALDSGRATRERAAARSRARKIQSTEKRGNVGFGVLLLMLTLTVVVVTVVMFETLAWLMA